MYRVRAQGSVLFWVLKARRFAFSRAIAIETRKDWVLTEGLGPEMTLLGLYCLDFRRGIAEEYDLGQCARTVLRCVEIATGELHACGTLELTRGPEDGRGEHQLSALERHRLVLARETARDVGTWGSPEVAAVLLDAAGSDAARMTLLSWRDNERWNCLHYAALWGSPETTKTLVETANAVGVLVQLL